MSEINNSQTAKWSEVDGSNTAAPPDGAPAGTFPNQAEGIWRAMMGSLKRFWDRVNGTVTVTGMSGAYVYTPVNASFPIALVTGEIYSWIANVDSAGGDTLNVNALGAKGIFKPSPGGMIAIGAADIKSGQMVQTAYDGSLASSAGGFHLLSPAAGAAAGNVVGPASAVAGNIATFADTTGKTLVDSGYTAGVLANNIVQLNASAQLPAVDGSNLINLAGTAPSGAITQFAGTAAPSGWLLCFGQAISRTTYATLFAITGTTYGIGDGSTTFNLPDCRGRAMFGKDDMGGSAASRITNAVSGITGTTLGASGGNQALHAHTHSYTAPSTMADGTSPTANWDAGNASAGNATATMSMTGTGASQNMPPTIIFNVIIKV